MPNISPPKGTAKTEALQAFARQMLAFQAKGHKDHMHHYGYFARLAYKHGVPVTEIAEAYEVTPDAIYQLIRRAAA